MGRGMCGAFHTTMAFYHPPQHHRARGRGIAIAREIPDCCHDLERWIGAFFGNWRPWNTKTSWDDKNPQRSHETTREHKLIHDPFRCLLNESDGCTICQQDAACNVRLNYWNTPRWYCWWLQLRFSKSNSSLAKVPFSLSTQRHRRCVGHQDAPWLWFNFMWKSTAQVIWWSSPMEYDWYTQSLKNRKHYTIGFFGSRTFF